MTTKGKYIEQDWNKLNSQPPALPCSPDLEAALASCSGEQAFQESLARHSEYLPHLANHHHGVWFDWVLYKYPLPTGNVTDFAYLETTSAENTIVLIEIEDPSKRMWKGPPNKPAKSVEFNAAIEQVTRWRTDLKDPQKLSALIADFKRMLGASGKAANPWKVVYGLVYGRSSENITDEQKAAYSDLQDSLGIKLMTFDHLVTRHKNSAGRVKNVMSVSVPGPTFSYLYLNAPPRSEFGYLTSGALKVGKEAREVIVSMGYDLDAWERGEPLSLNDKKPIGHISSIFPKQGTT
ncbi:DUF4263 domain-containing protein [Roseateles amylovorans]|uniref:DUF4263 domain-containing protein n=1 Tax=Roseateles amylovorans TaxID=2978473 RepID=A0ABY6AY26_9BURK|nr:DUF4263 domain-containing protein [Roseateles amylovorans]UXH76203.1 DUF4263 domain-containing protein [Roseateles amylovorans]